MSDHLGCLFINDPLFGILRIFDISEWRIGRKVFTALTLGLIDRTDLSAGVSCVEFVEPHPDPGEVIVHAVLIGRIEIIIDGYISRELTPSRGENRQRIGMNPIPQDPFSGPIQIYQHGFELSIYLKAVDGFSRQRPALPAFQYLASRAYS